MMKTKNNIPARHFRTRAAWRHWLEQKHSRQKAIWVIVYSKDSKVPCINQQEAVEEALCFGWIDSKSIKRDERSRYQYFSPRKPKSNWSKVNRERVERMIQEGRMAPAGQALIDLAKKSGTWEALADVENGIVPDDLMRAFARNKRAFKHFQGFAPSAQRILLQWVHMAKREETRKLRISKIVAMAAKNLKGYP